MKVSFLSIILFTLFSTVSFDAQTDSRIPLSHQELDEKLFTANISLSSRPENTTCHAPERPRTDNLITSRRAYPNLYFSSAVQLKLAPNDLSRWFLVQQGGRIHSFSTNEATTNMPIVMDISDKVAFTSGAGLTSLAFHPEYPSDGRFFVTYTAESGDSALPVANFLSSFTSNDSGVTFDPATEQVILTKNTRSEDHPWGMVEFGPDGYLFVGMGTTSPSTAQDTNDWQGSFVRIDVDNAQPYAIPQDNPFVNGGGAPEIYAWGFRNPFRWSFDSVGNLWAGDVGGNKWEEINLVVSGGNYGWSLKEGDICNIASCDGLGIIDQVSGYDRSDGGPAAVLGGRVYNGTLFPTLRGKYLFSDFVTGTIRTATLKSNGSYLTEIVGNMLAGVDIAEGPDGELYTVSSAHIRKLVPSTNSGSTDFPTKVSEIGCFNPSDPTHPGEALIPYDINVPFWSDGAVKERWFALPDGTNIHINIAGDFELPTGSMVFKNFRLNEKLIETRMLVLHSDNEWAGYSYEWNEQETDAFLVAAGGKEKTIDTQLYTYPGRSQCIQCHTFGAGHTLGLEIAQLNRPYNIPNSDLNENQLTTYEQIGLLDAPLSAAPEDLPSLPSITDLNISLHERARAYLHSNCSQCHMPGESGGGTIDFRYTTVDSGVINGEPSGEDLGVSGALLVTPGEPEKSLVNLRMRALDIDRMPPIGSNVIDVAGIALIDAWVNSLLVEPCSDNDNDGVCDVDDNCSTVPNPEQRDTDIDGFGNLCDADLDNNGSVSFGDLYLFRDRFGSSDPDADFDGSGTVSFDDLNIFRELFGKSPGPAGNGVSEFK